MFAKIAGWLFRLANWLHPAAVVLWVNKDEIYQLAKKLVAEAEAIKGSGEAKRHQVYAALIKAYPDVAKWDLSVAIEAALGDVQ